MNPDDYITGAHNPLNPANWEDNEESKTYDELLEVLDPEDVEVIENHYNSVDYQNRKMRAILANVYSYFNIKDFPLEKNSDEMEEMNRLEKLIKKSIGL